MGMNSHSRRQAIAYLAAAASFSALPAFGKDKSGAWTIPDPQPFKTTEIEWITLSDGTRLAARTWVPESAAKSPVGVVFEYIPYRARDLTRADDDRTGRDLASHGIAFVRVDMRGSGNSEGIKEDEFEAIETADALEVIDWLSKRPWCNGSVGMRGHSWGGNAALVTAVQNPPALKAILPSCAAGDRFRKDLHWIGGAPTQSIWPAMLKTVIASPPDPEIVGAEWKAQWLKRLNGAAAVTARWFDHQSADDYWAIGSAAPQYDKIRCAVYAVGGLADGFTNEILDIVAQLRGPRKGLVGAWGHVWPGDESPGPARRDWLREELRWWFQWLQGQETGIMAEPMLHLYVEDAAAAEVSPADVPGRWITETNWPSSGVAPRPFYLSGGKLTLTPPASVEEIVPFEKIVGRAWPEAMSGGRPEDLPGDQADDDRNSLCFDGDIVEDAFEIVGRPRVDVRIRADQPLATVAVRLLEVRPDGSSWPISFGALNLAHRTDQAHPEVLVPEQYYDVRIDLKFASRRIRPGSRLRVAISNGLWPILLPSPRPVRLAIESGANTALHLPIRAPRQGDPAGREHPPTRPQPASKFDHASQGGVIELVQKSPPRKYLIEDIGTTVSGGLEQVITIDEDNPERHSFEVRFETGLSRGVWQTRTMAHVRVEAAEGHLLITELTQAYEGDKQIFEKSFTTKVPRRFC